MTTVLCAESLQALKSSLEECRTRITELRGALEQEGVVSSNLRMELQIERSRCEALIAQEMTRASDALGQLEDQRVRCGQLADSLTQLKQDHARTLEEALAREKKEYSWRFEDAVAREKADYARKMEDAVAQEKWDYARRFDDAVAQEKVDYARRFEDAVAQEQQDYARKLDEAVASEKVSYTRNLDEEARRLMAHLQSQLEQEHGKREEQDAALRRLQEQAAHAKHRQQEEEAQQEAGTRLHAAMQGLQAQRQEVALSLEAEKHRATLLQAELDSLREKTGALKEKEQLHEEQRERLRRLERQEQEDRERQHERTSQKLVSYTALTKRQFTRVSQTLNTTKCYSKGTAFNHTTGCKNGTATLNKF